jgi:LacI family transcriptional regulator
MRPTIRDVAKKLNLSITTVSRALDGYDDVAEPTREQVVKTARQMGYSPNGAARQLRRQKAETIGFILPAGAQRFAEAFFTEFIAGLGQESALHNYDLLVSAADDEKSERNLYQRWANGGKVDGFVLNRLRLRDWRLKFLAEQKIPFASLSQTGKGNYPCIRIDGADGYIELIDHVYSHGFRRFAFVGGPANLVNHVECLDWFRHAMNHHGLVLDDKRMVSGDLSSSGGYQAAIGLLSLPDPPDAVICVNDETAFGVLHAAHNRGLEIGRQIAVAGFEGVQDAKHSEPPLTTLDIPVFDIARQLVDMLLKTLNGDAVESPVFVRPDLLRRPSTGG